MGAIRLIQRPQNGQIIINVPDEMRNETIVIEFRPVRDDEQASLAEVSEALFTKLNRVKTDFNKEDFNVYEQ